MKLNNKGWGTMEMLLLSGGLLIALLVAAFFISRLYSSYDGALNSTNNESIEDKGTLEEKLEKATQEYIEDNNIIVDAQYNVSFMTLKNNGYITSLVDDNNEECNGYVVVTNLDGKYYYQGYVFCN